MCAIKAVSAMSIPSFRANNSNKAFDPLFYTSSKKSQPDSFMKLYTKSNIPVDEQLESVTNDFCSTPVDKLKDKVFEVIEWGSGSLCALAAASLVAKNDGNVEDPDVKTAVKELLDPR